MTQVNVGDDNQKWFHNDPEKAKSSKGPDLLPALLVSFREAMLLGEFAARFFILIVDPTTHVIEKRTIDSLDLHNLGNFVIVDSVINRCYCPDTMDARSRTAAAAYCGDDTETVTMSPHSWNEAQGQFEQNVTVAREGGELAAFYNSIAEQHARETARIEKELQEAQQKRNADALRELAEMLSKIHGDSRLQKLYNFLAQLQRQEAKEQEERMTEDDKKQALNLRTVVMEEIQKEEIKKENIKDLNRKRDISISDL